MEDRRENQIPCIVGRGVLTSKKDMMRALRGLDHVRFIDMIDGKIEMEEEAFVVEVFSSEAESTIIFNRRIHLNVDNFEYLTLMSNQPGVIELVEGHRTLRFEALSDPFSNKDILMSEAIENRTSIGNIFEEEDIIFDDDF